MKHKKYMQVGWMLLLAVLIAAVPITSVSAASRTAQHYQNSASLNATIYLATGTLAPIFQSRINQQVPGAVNNAIANLVGKLPASDRGWANTMATTLIQPSATLTGIAPQQSGLSASLRLSLYPGDPQPIHASMLIKFSVLNSSTVQVSGQPLPGSPALVNGPITTMQVPIGQLNSITTTPTCGNSALAINLQVPVSLGQGQNAIQQAQQGQQSSSGAGIMQQQTSQEMPHSAQDAVTSYVEIPSSSLVALGNSIGSLPVSNNTSAQHIRVAVQGSDLIITSDIMLGTLFKLGTAVTTVQPMAVNGGLALHVLSTTLTVLQIFTFPYNSYNAQIEQKLNARLGTALAGKFNISNAAIGPNSSIPCAASDSLILTGTTSLI